jgi:hypothetical protein
MFDISRFGLFFSWILSEADWTNLERSQVRMVMLPWNEDISDDATLRRIARLRPGGQEVRVVLRIFPEELDTHVGTLQGRMMHVQSLCKLEAIQIGNEPDEGIDFSYGGEEWKPERIYKEHLPRLLAIKAALQNHGVQLITPGWWNRPIGEDGPPWPGQIALARDCAPVYNQFDGAGVHIYEGGWPNLPSPDPARPEYYGSWIDWARFGFKVGYYQSLWHKPVWIDEFNVNPGDQKPMPQTYHMAACISAAEAIMRSRKLRPRVEFFAPFVSNGYKESFAYPLKYIMDDPECYELVRAFVTRNTGQPRGALKVPRRVRRIES